MQSTAVDLLPQTAPSRLDGKGTAAIFHNTRHLMITGRFQKAHIQLLARYCAHKHRFPPPRSGCVFLVCVVWRRRNAGAGAPFHTSSLTDERHDTVAARGLDYLYIYSFSSAPSTDDPPPNLRIAPHFPPLQSTALACFVSFYTIHSIHCILTHCIPAVVHSM